MHLCRQRPSAKPSRDNQVELQEQQQSQMCLQLLTNLSQPSWSVSRHFAYAKKKLTPTYFSLSRDLPSNNLSHMFHVRFSFQITWFPFQVQFKAVDHHPTGTCGYSSSLLPLCQADKNLSLSPCPMFPSDLEGGKKSATENHCHKFSSLLH